MVFFFLFKIQNGKWHFAFQIGIWNGFIWNSYAALGIWQFGIFFWGSWNKFCERTIIINVIITLVTQSITVNVPLSWVVYRWTIVTGIADPVRCNSIRVLLSGIVYEWTIVRRIEDTVVIGVVVTSVTLSITVSIFLTTVRSRWTIVSRYHDLAFGINQFCVRYVVQICVVAAYVTITGPPDIALQKKYIEIHLGQVKKFSD